MPRLACFTCGRQIYTVAPLESLFAEERRCPRCGAFLNAERREAERRQMHRRMNPMHDPGPPAPAPKAGTKASNGAKPAKPAKPAEPVERRVAGRRVHRRRGGVAGARATGADDSAGWHD